MSGYVKCYITEYGYSNDPYMDSNTRNKIGHDDNILENRISCALTKSLLPKLGIQHKQENVWLGIRLNNGVEIPRRYDDTCPPYITNSDRVDLYNEKKQNVTGVGFVRVISQ